MTRALLALALLVAACTPGAVPGGGGDDDDGPPPGDAGVDAPPDAPVRPSVPPEVDGRITINELMATNAVTLTDEAGEAGDWIELYNPTDQAIPLRGYHLTDALAEPRKFALPAGVVVPARGRLLLWADDQPGRGPTHLGFKLGKTGELGLARPDGTWIDRVSYQAQEVDFSAAREPDGSDRWVIEWKPTPGAPNASGPGAPMGLEVASAPPEVVPAAGDLSQRILGDDVVLQLGIEVSPEGVAALETDPRTYVRAFLVHDGRRYGPVGLRLKGSNSFQPFSQKPSLRINMDEFVERGRFFGLKDLTLNNMSGDFSMMHERLSYQVARMAGIPASRASYAVLTINGQPYGLYANVETVKKVMLERWYPDATGPLFEATDVDFVPAHVPAYELESGPDDRTLLAGAAAALQNPSPDAAIAAVSAYVDLAQFQRFWATLSVVAQFDSFPYSLPGDDYFVYADPTTRRLQFLPWGMDEAMYSGQIDVTSVYSVLANQCKQSPACFQGYKDQVWAVLGLVEQANLQAERARIAAMIMPLVAADVRKPYSNEQVYASQQDLYWFLADRRLNLQAMLNPAPPPPPPPPTDPQPAP